MNINHFNVILFVCLVLGGCAVKPLAHEDARGVPDSRIIKKELLKQQEGRVEIFFIREDAVLSGTGMAAKLYLNGELVTSMLAGEKLSVWVEPQIYVVTLALASRLDDHLLNRPISANSGIPFRKVELDARVGRRYEVRVDLTNSVMGVPLQASSLAINK